MSSQDAGVLIIGGGLIGSAIAWRLAQKGQRVTLADAGNLGGEASTAGAGMLAPASEAAKRSAWLDLGLQSLKQYPDFLQELSSETGREVEFTVCGSLMLDGTEEAEAFHRAAGIRVQRRPEGLFYPDEAIVDPGALLRALRHACEKCGVTVEHRRIEEVNAPDHRAVVIAAGAWSSGIRVLGTDGPLALPPAIPVKGHLIAFNMRPGLLGPFLRKAHTYVLQRADGLVIAGATEEHAGFDTSVQTSACELLHRRAAEVVPALAAAEPVRRWIGFRPGPELEDGPILRRLPETNVWLAYGHYRNGILLTPVSAGIVAEQIGEELGR